MRETKDLRLDLKAVAEDGTFDGYLSVYDVVDLGNDVVERGAFTKTIQEQKSMVPMLWNHKTDTPIGVLHLQDADLGLQVRGEMFIEESAKAKEIHGIAKRFHAIGKPMGLSIGYEAIKKEIVKGVRRLRELKLHEGSMTLFPMLPVATLTSIKAGESVDETKDFLSELNRMQVFRLRSMMLDALFYSLDDALYSKSDAATSIQLSQESIDQFRSAYLEHLPVLLDMWGVKSENIVEAKVGRRISSASRTMIEEAINNLQALLNEGEGTSEEEAADPAEAAADKGNEPEALHSWLSETLAEYKARLASIQ